MKYINFGQNFQNPKNKELVDTKHIAKLGIHQIVLINHRSVTTSKKTNSKLVLK
jgi:hypothetical protein